MFVLTRNIQALGPVQLHIQWLPLCFGGAAGVDACCCQRVFLACRCQCRPEQTLGCSRIFASCAVSTAHNKGRPKGKLALEDWWCHMCGGRLRVSLGSRRQDCDSSPGERPGGTQKLWWGTPALYRILRNHLKMSKTVSRRVSGNSWESEQVSGQFFDVSKQVSKVRQVFQIVF